MTVATPGGSRATAQRPAPVRIDVAVHRESLAVVRQALTGIAAALDLDQGVLDDLKVAVTEACTNVVLHAFPDGPGRMELHVWAEGDRLVVLVRDRGRGLSSPIEPGGAGLGLRMIAALAADVSIATEPGRGTDVRMTFATREATEPL